MAGMPFSGKSVFAKALADNLNGNPELIDPKNYIPPEGLGQPDIRQEFQIAAWNVCLEYANNLLLTSNRNVVILDTTAANYTQIHKLIIDAKIKKHSILYIFVLASKADCIVRAGDQWISEDTYKTYKHRFKQTVPEFTRMVDRTLVVRNDEKIDKMVEMAARLATKLNAVH